eukprot:gene40822-49788_t
MIDGTLVSIGDRIVVEFAIFFHDIVYDPSSQNNEEASAQLFFHHFKDYLPQYTLNEVCRYIEATKTHKCDRPDDFDLRVFLDIDLLILASASEHYMQYAQRIRREYIAYSDDDYRAGRMKVLEAFLNPERRLFQCDTISSLHEDKARENIRREHEHLKSTGLL